MNNGYLIHYGIKGMKWDPSKLKSVKEDIEYKSNVISKNIMQPLGKPSPGNMLNSMVEISNGLSDISATMFGTKRKPRSQVMAENTGSFLVGQIIDNVNPMHFHSSVAYNALILGKHLIENLFEK